MANLPSIKTIESGKAILFLGAGFSKDAKNSLGENIKDGAQLIEYLLNKINEPDHEGYDLETASQEFINSPLSGGEKELTRILHGNFSAREYTQPQRIIACQPWYRIYTTNYDNVVENIFAEEGKIYTEKSIHDQVSPPLKNSTQIIHIYGSIKNISPDEFKRTFLLTESQRDQSEFIKSSWYRRFCDDILAASALYFVGYSASDVDIRRILKSISTHDKKIHFITWDGEKRPIITRMKRFGEVHTIGIECFSEHLKEKRLDATRINYESPPMMLRELTYTPQERYDISSRDIGNLMISGEVEIHKISRADIERTAGSYLIPRSKLAVDRAINNSRYNIPILIHGDIGNGKTIFSYIIGYRFHLNGYRVYKVKKEPEIIGDIISYLQSVDEKTLIIFDDIMKFKTLTSSIINIHNQDIILLGTVRSNVIDTSRAAVRKKFNDLSAIEIDLNDATTNEIKDWVRYLDENGLFGDNANLDIKEKINFIERRCGRQMRDLILDLYSNGALHTRVSDLLDHIGSLKPDYKNIIGLSALLTICDFQEFSSYTDLSELVYTNISIEEFRLEISEIGLSGILKMNNGEVTIKSPALAQFILSRTFGLPEVLRIAKMAATYINDYLSDEYDYLLFGKTLLKFSSFHYLIKTRKDGELLEKYYDECRVFKFAQSDPLFWVQRSICCMKIPAFDLAEKFVDTAYSKSKVMPNFDTYQIDNHHARLILTKALVLGVSEDGKEEWAACTLLQSVILRKSDDLYHPLSVMRLFSEIVTKWGKELNRQQKKSILQCIEVSIKSIEKSSNLISRFRGIQEIEKLMRRSKIDLEKN